MNDQLDSQLSALSDGEMTELELRSLLKQLENCSEAERAVQLQKWSRYQLVSEALSDERGGHTAKPNFATAVAEAIVLEPSHVQADADDSTEFDAPGIVASPGGAPLWSRFAVAATVTLAVIVGVQQYQLNGAALGSSTLASDDTSSYVTAPTSEALAVQVNAQPVNANVDLASDGLRAQERLHEYLLEHANHAARQNGQGIVPFARVANFEED